MHVERALLVLRLGATQRRLQGHHALPVRCEAALFAGAIAVLAVPFVTLQGDLQPVIATARTVGRRTWRYGTTAGAGGAAAHIVLRVDHVRVGHGIAVPVLLRNHAKRTRSINYLAISGRNPIKLIQLASFKFQALQPMGSIF